MKHQICVVVGGLIAIPVLFLGALALITPITWSGVGYLVGFLLVAIGCLVAPWQNGRFALIGWLGLGLVLGTAVFRIFLVSQNSTVYLITLPGGKNGRILNNLIDEQNMTLFGFRPAAALGLITHREAEDGFAAFVNLYQELHQITATPPSPVVATYLGLQEPTAFDLLVIEPEGETNTAVIFLHGFGGSFAFECWAVAQAARQTNVLTVCPAVGWIGDWWTDDGAVTLQTTLDYLHGRKIEHIFLAGLSNGGLGASLLAPRFSSQLDGLILISGVSPQAQDSKLPTLLIHGVGDERIPAALAAQFTAVVGENATYMPVESDHFMLAKEADVMRDTIAAWLRRHHHSYQLP